MTQMEDNALNKDHSRTTSMPTSMAELGSDDSDQELTLSLLGSDQDAFGQIEAALTRIEDGSYGQCEKCGGKIPKSRLTPSLIPHSASNVLRSGKTAIALIRSSARNGVGSVYFNFVDHLSYSADLGYSLLGDLLFVETE